MPEDTAALFEIEDPDQDRLARPGALAAVEFIHVRDHKFEKKPKKENGKVPPGCAVCGAGKARMVHVGAPPSLNVGGSGWNRMAFYDQKRYWQERLAELIEATGMPKGLDSVYAEGQIGFGTRTKRDQGNYRYLLEKALGDALKEGGWIADDDWDHYEFGNLRYAHDKGQSWTSVTLWPVALASSGQST